MKSLFGKIKAGELFETLGVSMVVGSIATYSVVVSVAVLGAFLVWLIESAN